MPEYWSTIARDYLTDLDVPEAVVGRHHQVLAQQLADCAEQFLDDDLHRLEHDHDEMLRDAYENRRLAEAKGK